jgi:hypothetical protein
MKKQITIQATENGLKYFKIYEVKVIKHNGDVHIYERYMSRKEAEKDCDFIHDTLSNLYKSAYIMEQIVYC